MSYSFCNAVFPLILINLAALGSAIHWPHLYSPQGEDSPLGGHFPFRLSTPLIEGEIRWIRDSAWGSTELSMFS